MNNELLFRVGKKKDTSTIVEFNYRMARETEDKELDKLCLEKGVISLISDFQKGFYLVAEDEQSGVVASLMVTKEWSDWRNGYFWWIQSVYVSSDFRRRGIYSELYANIKNRAENNEECCGLRLYVDRENLIAQRAYSALGMQETFYKLFEEEF